MIVDQIKNWKHYPYGNAWKQAFNFLEILKVDSEEKKYIISADDIFAIVTSYKTRSYKDAIFETHRKYIDIQAVLSGRETLEWSTKEGQQVESPYDQSKDVEFYDHGLPRTGKIDMYPGIFVMLLPQDAHMPSLIFKDNVAVVKKVVIKIKVDLLS